MHIRSSALALAVAAALSAQISVRSAKADTPAIQGSHTSGSSSARPHFKYPNRTSIAASTVLYDQSGAADGSAPTQNYQAIYDVYDSEAADDFVVTDAAGWSISAFNFQVEFIGGSAPADTKYDIHIYADENALPGTDVCDYPGVLGALDANQTNLSVALPTSCLLGPGHYWVSVIPNLDFPPKMRWMAGQGAAIDNIGAWREPLDGDNTGCTSWTTMSTCSNGSAVVGSGDFNLLFQVIGSVGANAGCQPSGICLVSTVGTDLSAGACGATNTIDATVGDQLNFCYTITNNTGIELDFHTLQNNIDGTLLQQANQALMPGATYQFNHIETVGATNVYNSMWTAQDIRSGFVATVESGGSCLDRIFADGFDNAPAPCNGNAFVDITGTGMALGLSDSGIVDVSMPFSFNFFGATSNILTVANNGGVIFNSPGTVLDYLNESLPAGNLSGPAILPLWDDFDSESGEVYTDTRGVSPNRQFIVEWFNRVHFDGAQNTDGATFELILNEDGTIQFEYADVSYSALGNLSADPDDCTGGVCATIGLQNDVALFNAYSAFQASVTDNSGIKWTPATPQIFTAGDTVTVSVGAPQIVINPNTLGGTVAAGGTSSILFSVENHGDRDLNWTLGEAAASNLHFPPPGTRFVMPLGDPATKSAGRAPITAQTKAASSHLSHGPFINSAVPTFAADIFQNNIETFDAQAPQTIGVVAPITDGTVYVGGAFIDGDFSKLYAITGDFGNNPSDLYTIDTTSGVPTLIGNAANAPGEGYSGLAYDGTSGTLYAATATCGTASHLWTIDPVTAAPSGVGEITGAPCIVAIAINAVGEMYGLDIVTDALYAIDKTNGNAALIGSIGFNANFAQDMAFDQSTGLLYLAGFDFDTTTDSIYTVDLTTGAANIIGPIGPFVGEVDAMGIETVGGPCMQPQDLPWLSLSPTAGTTPPLSASPIAASIDGTGSVAGDTLSGTVCARSNDPMNRTVATPITVDVVSAPPLPPTLTKAFSPATVPSSAPSKLTITLGNNNAVPATLSGPLTDTFPSGLIVAPTPNELTDCGGAVTAVAGADSVTLANAGAAIPANGACTITVDVIALSGGIYANDIPPGALQTSAGVNATSADASLLVLDAPTLTKQFNPQSVPAGTPSTLTIMLGNQNGIDVALSAPLTDAFPPGLLIAATPNATSTCGGTVTAVAGSNSVTLDAAGSMIPAVGSCWISLDVVSATPASYANDIPAGALQTDAGANAGPADDTLLVTP